MYVVIVAASNLTNQIVGEEEKYLMR